MALSSSDKQSRGSGFSIEAITQTGLWSRIVLTLSLLFIYRLGVSIGLPYLDASVFQQNSNLFSSGVLGMVDLFSGGALSGLSIVALGIGPYITASIMMQLLSEIFPQLKTLQREHGEDGRKEYQQWTRRLSILLAAFQAFGLVRYLQVAGARIYFESKGASQLILVDQNSWLLCFKLTLILVAGSAFVMWLGELISEFGIGNGGSLLIFAGIAARFPSQISQTQQAYITGAIPTWGLVSLIVFFCLIILAIIYIQEGARKLLIVGAKDTAQYEGGRHYLPLKLNPAGVLPIIFASMTVFIPYQLMNFAGKSNVSISTALHDFFLENKFLKPVFEPVVAVQAIGDFFSWLGGVFDRLFAYGTIEYAILYFSLIMVFAYFYASILLNPREIAENLQKGGSSIQGIKPGKQTGDYLEGLLNRLVFVGGSALALITILPMFAQKVFQVSTLGGLQSTSLIIMTGVAIDLYNQVQSYMQAHQYKVRSLI